MITVLLVLVAFAVGCGLSAGKYERRCRRAERLAREVLGKDALDYVDDDMRALGELAGGAKKPCT